MKRMSLLVFAPSLHHMVGSRVHAVEPRLRIPKILATENQLARRSLIWLVVGNMFYFSIYWESSSQLTFIFFRGVGLPPTRHVFVQILTCDSKTLASSHSQVLPGAKRRQSSAAGVNSAAVGGGFQVKCHHRPQF